MNESEKTALKNVLVVAMIDGEISAAERQLIRRLRKNLGLDGDEFRQLCEQVQANRKRLEIPTGPMAAERMLGLLMDVAKADGDISADEQRILEKVAAYIDRNAMQMESAVAEAAGVESAPEVDVELEAEINRAIDELYAEFADWSADERLSHCRALGNYGESAVIALLRVVESYRRPDGGQVHAMKAMIMEQLAAIGDDCVVYYLAQQVSLGDTEDEVTSATLREAAADAIGKITGKGFTRDAAGVQDCREWWAGEGTNTYRSLVL